MAMTYELNSQYRPATEDVIRCFEKVHVPGCDETCATCVVSTSRGHKARVYKVCVCCVAYTPLDIGGYLNAGVYTHRRERWASVEPNVISSKHPQLLA